jgi:hypothetical protein
MAGKHELLFYARSVSRTMRAAAQASGVVFADVGAVGNGTAEPRHDEFTA